MIGRRTGDIVDEVIRDGGPARPPADGHQVGTCPLWACVRWL
jgi:hypothetical protein